MNEIDKAINRTILSIGQCRLTFAIILSDDDPNILGAQQNRYHNGPKLRDTSREVDNNTIHHNIELNYTPMVYIKANSKLFWDRGRKAMIIMTMRNQHIIVEAFRRMMRIMHEDVFYMENGVLQRYALKEEWIVREYPSQKDSFVLTPTLIKDESDGRLYEGVNMLLNDSEIYIDFTFDEFMAVFNALSRIDLFLYSQSLLNFYIEYKKHVEIEHRETKIDPMADRKALFTVENPQIKGEEFVQSTPKPKPADDIMASLSKYT